MPLKESSTIGLDDCGRERRLIFGALYQKGSVVKVQMVIKAPKGTLVLFDRNYISPDTQCEAIRAFMEEYSGKDNRNE